MNHLYVTKEEYIDLCERLVARVLASGWKYDSILCLARGGMRPGDIFSRVSDMPLSVLSTSSYRAAAGTVQGNLDIAGHITGVSAMKGKLLLVDDLVDSGVTIAKVVEHLKKSFPEVTEIRVAVLWYKQCSVLKPDYYVQKLEDNPWIHQPFELYDNYGEERFLADSLKKFGDKL